MHTLASVATNVTKQNNVNDSPCCSNICETEKVRGLPLASSLTLMAAKAKRKSPNGSIPMTLIA
jgi:hypothetical protein